MNEVALRANEVLRNDVMLRILDKRTEISYNVYEINQSLRFFVTVGRSTMRLTSIKMISMSIKIILPLDFFIIW